MQFSGVHILTALTYLDVSHCSFVLHCLESHCVFLSSFFGHSSFVLHYIESHSVFLSSFFGHSSFVLHYIESHSVFLRRFLCGSEIFS